MDKNNIITTLKRITMLEPESAPKGKIPSAVLVPVIDAGDAPQVILTVRAATLRHHAGQISFPGGRINHGETPLDAALRESHEEIDLNPNEVDILGFLPGVITTANFHIAPVLGIIRSTPHLTPALVEVERIIIEPLEPLLDPQNHHMQNKKYNEINYKTWVIKHPTEYIWGATAKMMVQWSKAMGSKMMGSQTMSENKHPKGQT